MLVGEQSKAELGEARSQFTHQPCRESQRAIIREHSNSFQLLRDLPRSAMRTRQRSLRRQLGMVATAERMSHKKHNH